MAVESPAKENGKAENSAGRGGGQVRWMGAVFTTALFVMVALSILLVANTRSASLGAEQRAAQGMDTLSRIATDWVGTRVNMAQTDHCGCVRSERSSVCIVTPREGGAGRRTEERPTLTVQANGELRVTVSRGVCPLVTRPEDEATSQAADAAQPKSAADKEQRVAAPEPSAVPGDADGQLVPMTGLFAQLRAQFDSARTLDGVVLEALDEPKEPGAAPRVHTILELGRIPAPAAKSTNQEGILQGALAPREIPPRTLHFDRDGLNIKTHQTWRLRGFSGSDPLDVMFHLGGVHFYVMTLVALILMLTWPAFKVWLMGPLERVSSRDVIHLLVGIPAAVAVAVIYLRGALIYQDLNLLTHDRLSKRVERTGAALEATLGELANQTRYAADLVSGSYVASATPGDRLEACTGDFEDLRSADRLPLGAGEPLAEFAQRPSQLDPDRLLPFSLRLRRFTGLAADGAQLVRIAFPDHDRSLESRVRRTPMFKYPDRTYFKQAIEVTPGDDAVFAEVNVSRAAGDRQLILATRESDLPASVGAPLGAPSSPRTSAVTTLTPQVWTASFALDENRPSPTQGVPSPPGSGIAIVDSQGRVLVHTIPERVLAENLFAATDAEAELRALARRLDADAARDARSLSGPAPARVEGLTFDYYGEPQFAAIRRVEPSAALRLLGETDVDTWYVIAFEPVDAARSIVSDIVLIGVGLLAFLLLVRVLLAVGVAQLFGTKIEWWWPGSPDDQRRKQSFVLATLGQLAVCAGVLLTSRLGLAEVLVAASLLVTLSYLGSRLLLSPRIREELSMRPRADAWFGITACLTCVLGLMCLASGVFGIQACCWIAGLACLVGVARYWVSIPVQGSLLSTLAGKIEPARAIGNSAPLGEQSRWMQVHLRWVYGPFVFFSSAVFGVFAYVSVQTVAELEVLGSFAQATNESASVTTRPNWAAEILNLLPVVSETSEQIRNQALSRASVVSVSYDALIDQVDQQAAPPSSKWRRTSLGRWVPRALGWMLVLVLSRALLIALSKRVFGLGIVSQVLPLRKQDRETRQASMTFVLGASIPPAALAPGEAGTSTQALRARDPANGPLPEKHLQFDLGRGGADVDAWVKAQANDDAESDSPLRIDFLGCELVLFDAQLREVLLRALECVVARQLAGSPWVVRVVSERELMTAFIEREHEFATSPVDERSQLHAAEVQRWARVLSLFDFTVNRIFESGERHSVHAPSVAVRLPEQRPDQENGSRLSWSFGASRAAEAECLRHYVERELMWDPLLSTLRDRILQKLEGLAAYRGRALTENEVLNTIITMTGARHRYLWGTCTDQEKLLLIQLAHEGFINPHRWALARRLCRRGLIDFGPNFRIRARSFDIFVHRALPPDLLHAWERAHRSGQWQHASTALALITLSLFGVLALGLPELTQGRMGVALTTLVGWFVVANRLNLLGGAAGGVPEALTGLFPKR